MEENNFSELTAAQLRSWLQKLNMPTTGTKNNLILRLSEIPASIRGDWPVDVSGAAAVTDDKNEYNEERLTKYVEEQSSPGVSGANVCQEKVKTDRSVLLRELELFKRELEIVKREKELLKQENELLKKMKEFEKQKENLVEQNKNESVNESKNNGGANDSGPGSNNDAVSNNESVGANESGGNNNNNDDEERKENECSNDRANDSDGEVTSEGNNLEINNGDCHAINFEKARSNANDIPFSLVKDLLPEYDGSTNPVTFVTQVKNVLALYPVSEATIKALLMSKVRGKAQSWLHSKSNFLYEELEVLLNEMTELFGTKENKLSVRRKFELRKWQFTEDFLTYFNEKVTFAEHLSIPEDELIDYLIEGIPDENLRIHANMQCFKSKIHLLNAFSKITLKKQQPKVNRGKAEVRCYNCNCMGHYASECQKPKREVGACYGCGSLSHLVAVCPERKPSGSKNA